MRPARSGDPAPPYKIATISRLSAFSPQRLRAWERRYDLLRPERGPGGHRLYGADDLQVLRAVGRLLASGRSIGEINSIGREALLGGSGCRLVTPDLVQRWTERIVHAAVELDQAAMERVLDSVFSALPPEDAIGQVIVESLRRIGRRWSQGQCSVASEHMATGVVLNRVGALVQMTLPEVPADAPGLVCACLPGERHDLGLRIIAFSLASRGARITMLGADVPFTEVERACRVLAPRAVLLSVSNVGLFRNCRNELVELRKRVDSSTVIVLGGRGIPADASELRGGSLTAMPPDQPLAETVGALRKLVAIQETAALSSGQL